MLTSCLYNGNLRQVWYNAVLLKFYHADISPQDLVKMQILIQ